MGVKQSEMMWFGVVKANRTVRYPDGFMLNIHRTARSLASGFLRKSAWEKRPVKDTQLHFSGVIWNSDEEETGILIVYINKIDTEIWSKSHKPQTLPVKKILRHGN